MYLNMDKYRAEYILLDPEIHQMDSYTRMLHVWLSWQAVFCVAKKAHIGNTNSENINGKNYLYMIL